MSSMWFNVYAEGDEQTTIGSIQIDGDASSNNAARERLMAGQSISCKAIRRPHCETYAEGDVFHYQTDLDVKIIDLIPIFRGANFIGVRITQREIILPAEFQITVL